MKNYLNGSAKQSICAPKISLALDSNFILIDCLYSSANKENTEEIALSLYTVHTLAAMSNID